MTMTMPGERTERRAKLAIIDADIHPALPRADSLDPYLAAEWVRHRREVGLRNPQGGYYPKDNPNAARTDSWPPTVRRSPPANAAPHALSGPGALPLPVTLFTV